MKRANVTQVYTLATVECFEYRLTSTVQLYMG